MQGSGSAAPTPGRVRGTGVSGSPATKKGLKQELVRKLTERPTPASDDAAWHHRLAEFMHSPSVELALTGLLILDILCVCAEILIGLHVLHIELDLAEEQLHRLGHVRRDQELRGSLRSAEAAAGTHVAGHDSLHVWEEAEHVIHLISIVILCAFSVELCLLAIALGRRFFSSIFYVFDAIVIGSALYLDVTVQADEGGGLLLLLRLWRLVRIIHGTYVVGSHELEHALEHMQSARECISSAQTCREPERARLLAKALDLLADDHMDEEHPPEPLSEGALVMAPVMAHELPPTYFAPHGVYLPPYALYPSAHTHTQTHKHTHELQN
eukprot:Tamp_14885.p1 GENE.Tamp_14885~~Tamp_14885.p1  ORF type:complete len:326 (-),score=56.04 Tamp_14885:594-1571(-)